MYCTRTASVAGRTARHLPPRHLPPATLAPRRHLPPGTYLRNPLFDFKDFWLSFRYIPKDKPSKKSLKSNKGFRRYVPGGKCLGGKCRAVPYRGLVVQYLSWAALVLTLTSKKMSGALMLRPYLVLGAPLTNTLSCGLSFSRHANSQRTWEELNLSAAAATTDSNMMVTMPPEPNIWLAVALLCSPSMHNWNFHQKGNSFQEFGTCSSCWRILYGVSLLLGKP